MNDVLAWHFVENTLRDGRPIPADGEKLEHEGEIALCSAGLHASEKLMDALQYAPGNTLCRVRCGGTLVHGDNKLVCTERTILWRIDAENVLRRFAQLCALDVLHLWNPPDIVVKYLNTGDESIRVAARNAARSAAWGAEWSAARSAAWDAMGTVAHDAARSAAWGAAWAMAWDTGRDKAWAEARASSNDAQSRRLDAMIEIERQKQCGG